MRDVDFSRALATIAASASTTAQTAPAEEIRRRGALRRKHRVVTLATGTAVTLVAAFGVAFGISDQFTGQPQPAASESPPSVTNSALLQVADLEALEEPDAGWQELSDPPEAAECAPTSLSVPETSKTLRRSFTIDSGYRLDQVIYDFPTTEAARQAFDSESARVLECRPEGGDLTDAWRLDGVGDKAVMAQFVTPRPDAEAGLVTTVRIAWSGRAVTSVVTSGLQQDWGLADWKQLGAAVDKLCEAADGSCVRDAELIRTYPAPSAAPGFLQMSDLPSIPGVQWDAGAVREIGEPGEVESVCDLGLISRSGPRTTQERVYSGAIGDTPAAVAVVEAIIGFGTPADAGRYLTGYESAYSNCPEVATRLTPLSIDLDGLTTVSAWSAPEIWSYFAAIQVGDTVVIVTSGAGGDEVIEVSQFRSLVVAAVKRLG